MSTLLRVAVVQMDPKVEDVAENIKKAEEMTAELHPGSVDLVCFPEMAFTGYIFESYAALEPYLESPPKGPTSAFCRTLAQRLQCHVIAGYPENLHPAKDESIQAVNALEAENTPQKARNPMTGRNKLRQLIAKIPFISSPGTKLMSGRLAGNSAVLFDPAGQLIGGYRKSNLFRSDVPWAQAGPGFTTFTLPAPLNKIAIAICMDLNPFPPYDWEGSGPPHELADYCIAQDIDLLILPCAWCDSEQDPGNQWDLSTIDYWSRRLGPLWEETSDGAGEGKSTTVVVCNRTGFERGTLFAGTSTVFRMRRGAESPEIVGTMGRKFEGCKLWTIDLQA